MKYSVPNRKKPKYLKKADEIKIRKSDFEKTLYYIENYPNAEIVLCISGEYPAEDLWINESEIEVTCAELEKFNEEAKGRFAVEIEVIRPYMVEWLKVHGIPFFWKFPVTTFDELKALKDLGVAQVLIDGPLFFNQKRVQRFGLTIRAIPNVCYEDYLPRQTGLFGTWMRPQDQDLYEDFIHILEFKHDDPAKWEATFDIYSEEKNYIGDLNILFQNFGFVYPVFAAAIPDGMVESRLNCNQECMYKSCRLCPTALSLGLTVQKEEADRLKQNN